MKKNKIIQKIKRKRAFKEAVLFGKAIGKRSIAANSASIAFYVFISMIPLFILLCSQLPMTGISEAELTNAVTDMMPETIRGLVASTISEAYYSRIGVFSFSIIMLLWSSSKGVLALIRSLDIVYDVRDSRNIINMYVFSIFYTVCLLFMSVILVILYSKELSAEELLVSTMPTGMITDELAHHLKTMDVIFAATIIAALVYKIAPAGKRKFAHQLPGALFSAAAISIFSAYFAVYTSGSNIYKSFYGSLTTVCILLMWLYSCINIFLIGGVINYHFRAAISNTYDKITARLKIKERLMRLFHRKQRAGVLTEAIEIEKDKAINS